MVYFCETRMQALQETVRLRFQDGHRNPSMQNFKAAKFLNSRRYQSESPEIFWF